MAKQKIGNYVFLPGISLEDNLFPNAYALINANLGFIKEEAVTYISNKITTDTAANLNPIAVGLLTSNLTFLKDEITAWITARVAAGTPPFNGYTFDIAKCKRDAGYIIDALVHDLRYGGNEDTLRILNYYWLSGAPQIDGDRTPEVAAYNQLNTIITDYIFVNSPYSSEQSPVTSTQTTGSAAEVNAAADVSALLTVVKNVIQNGMSAAPAVSYSAYNFAEYIYDEAKCARDIGYVLTGYLHDLRYGGNIKTRFNASRYWDGTVPQVDGDRKPEIATHNFIRDLINNVVLHGSAVAKCERDIGYLVDGVAYDAVLGTNYNSVFLGLAEYNSQDVDDFVITTIQTAADEILALSEVSSSPTATSRVNTFFDEVIDVATNGRSAANTLTFTNPPTATASQIAAKDKLIANRDFIAAEVNAWVSATYPSANHDYAKCTRDVHYAIDAICYDILYGGNSATYAQAKFFFYAFADGSAGIDPTHKSVTVAAYDYLKSFIDEIVVGTTISKTTSGSHPNTLTQDVSGNNASTNDAMICQALAQITADVISAGSQAAANLVLTSITKEYPASAWASAPLQAAKAAILTNKDSIITTAITYVPLQNTELLQDLTGLASEAAATTKIVSLANVITTVITGGLNSVPARENGVSQIKIQGKVDLDDILLISNATRNEVIYNFTDPALGATVDVNSAYNSNAKYTDADFPTFLQTADYVTTIYLKADTSTHANADDVQIFIEVKEMKVRPYDFGTDAIERMRVALPQAMLDADFEYGLQPTKWQAIGLARGYPSVYEIPGSDLTVFNVTTDASNGTGGVGSSLITVTTAGAHGYTAGQAFTIKALGNSVQGFARAEGTFLVNSVTGSTTFTYYASSKVGTSVGQVLSTSYTQLRKAGFYTGATVGVPTFSVYSQGINGTVTTDLITPNAADQIGFLGTPPVVSAPISGSGVASGTQVTGINGTGSNVTVTSTTNASIGATSFDVSSTTGLVENMAINRGDGQAVFINDITGSTVTLSGGITSPLTGTTSTFTGISGSNIAPTGTLSQFNINQVNGVYTTPSIAVAGQDYSVGDRVRILGSSLGGGDGVNDAIVRVTSVGGTGDILTAVIHSGTSVSGDVGYSSVPWSTNGSGIELVLNVTRHNSAYVVSIATPGSLFATSNTITVLGSQLGGVDTTNDLVLTVDSIDGGGGVLTFTQTGTAVSTDVSYTNLSGTNVSPIGTSGTFNVTRTVGIYSVTANTNGTSYDVGDRILFLGTALFGTTPTNDLIIRVTTVNGSGAVTGVTVVSGSANASGSSIDFVSTISISAPTVASIPDATTLTFNAIAVVQVTFTTPHGLVPGTAITVSISSSGTNHELAGGAFLVEQVPSSTIVRYTARTTGTIDTATSLLGTIYTKSDAYFVHRPFDGGVQLGAGGPQHGAQAIRQSKKYIRYQSGKGAMYTTGALFAPSYDIQSISADGEAVGSYITLTTDDVDHGCQVGGVIKIIGVDTGGYNGTYTVVDIINERTLKVQAQSVLSSTVALLTAQSQMSILRWHGASVRAGCFDEQNGMFWEYDGSTLSVGRRSSTFQISGVISIAKDTNSITGTNTRFRDQLVAGDRIVIRGMTHVVTNISSNTTMTVAPDFRGVNSISGAKACKIQDLLIPQHEWNLDRLDGTGPSGYNLDITKMQMIGIQYSWYGAGFIDFMLRGSDGNFIFCHRIRNSNVNSEAYMRTGNMPVRYEVINEARPGRLISAITDSQTTIPLVDAGHFPVAGTVYIDNELISYTGKNNDTLIGCTRAASLTNYAAGSNRTYTAGPASLHQQNTGVIIASNTISPIISHWGSAYLIDGKFDEDRGYLFSYASTGISISTTKTTAFLIRLAPSVSNAIIGDLGERELLNRAQLLLKELTITADAMTTGGAGLVIEGVLNPSNYPLNPGDVTWGGLSGLAQGGQPSFAQIAPGGSINWNSGASQVTASATTLTSTNGNLVVPTGTAFNRNSGTTIAYVTRTSWNSIGAEVGFAVTDSKFPSATTITNRTDSPNPVATTLGQINTNITVFNGGGAIGFNVGSTVIRISKASWESATNPVTAVGFTERSGYFPAGTRITTVSPIIGSGSNQYYEVTFSNASLYYLGPGYAFTISIGGAYTTASTLYFTSASWLALPVDVPFAGTATNDSKFVGGTTISAITALRTFAGTGYYAVNFSNSTASISGGATVTFNTTPYYTVTFSKTSTSAISNTNNIQLTLAPNTIATNYVYFTQASWEGLVSTYSAGVGTELSDAKFAAGTRISAVSVLKTFASVGYYTVTFNQTSNAVIAGGGTVTFKFGAPPYALPGETVFSFIANPGERSMIDLGDLKELTNTTLGGRGAYPNGPDVMAINVYKVSGTAVTANLVLRWGEAQA